MGRDWYCEQSGKTGAQTVRATLAEYVPMFRVLTMMISCQFPNSYRMERANFEGVLIGLRAWYWVSGRKTQIEPTRTEQDVYKLAPMERAFRV